MVRQSAQAAITKCHRRVAEATEFYFLTVRRLEAPGQARRVCLRRELSSWLADGHLLTVTSQRRERQTESSLIRTLILGHQGPTLRALFNLNCSLRATSQHRQAGGQGSAHGVGGVQVFAASHNPCIAPHGT